MTWSWAVNSAGECHVDIVEVGSSILPSPTKAYSIPDKELDRPFFLCHIPLKTGVGTKMGTKNPEISSPELYNPIENDEINPIKRDNLAKKKGSELV